MVGNRAVGDNDPFYLLGKLLNVLFTDPDFLGSVSKILYIHFTLVLCELLRLLFITNQHSTQI